MEQENPSSWNPRAAGRGVEGVPGQSVAEFEQDLKGNLFRLWNRLSSGSYL
jgi:hypothetical protein